MRLIADGVVEREGVPGLARAPRLFAAPPHPAADRRARRWAARAQPRAPRAHRAHAAGRHRPAGRRCRVLAGFASVRQFNDTVREVFGMPPLRAARRRRASGGPASAARGDRPHAAASRPARRSRAVRLDGGACRRRRGVGDPSSFARTLRLAGGPAWFELRLDEAGRVRLRVRLSHLGDLSTVVTRARRLFDLDADPIAVDDALAAHRNSHRSSRPCPASACPVPPTRTRC